MKYRVDQNSVLFFDLYSIFSCNRSTLSLLAVVERELWKRRPSSRQIKQQLIVEHRVNKENVTLRLEYFLRHEDT